MPWSGGLAEWIEGDTLHLSIAFTWKIDEAFARAQFGLAQGYKVKAGGPALFMPTLRERISAVAEVGSDYPEAVTKHNPLATFASRGCPVGCSFCIVPKLEGLAFTLIPDFVPRPILCDNNLSALPDDYQEYIIAKYNAANVRLIDANSGFEPITFTGEVYERWKPLINAGGGPWRFAYDETRERAQVLKVMRMLADEPPRRKRVYVLIGNEPKEDCLRRIQEVIDHGCEPHVQPIMRLNALDRKPWIRHDWTDQSVRAVARWANSWSYKRCSFEEWDPKLKREDLELKYDAQQGLFA